MTILRGSTASIWAVGCFDTVRKDFAPEPGMWFARRRCLVLMNSPFQGYCFALSVTILPHMILYLDVVIEYLVRVITRAIKRRRSRGWPTTKATVVRSDCPKTSSCDLAEVVYLYRFKDERYSGTDKKPFLSQTSAKDYISHYPPGTEFNVRVKPEDPEVSVVH